MRGVVPIAMLVLVAVALGTPEQAAARTGAKGSAPQAGVYLYSLTTGAHFFLDGQEFGVVPLEGLIPLTPGQHTLKLIRRGFAQRTEVVELAPGEELELEWDLVPFAGVVRITSNAGKAALWLNGKPFGEIPFDGEIPMGKHKIKAVASGFTPVEQEVEFNGGEEYELRLDMEVAPMQPVTAASQAPLYRQWWFWTATGAVVMSGIITALVLSSGDDGGSPPSPEHTLVF